MSEAADRMRRIAASVRAPGRGLRMPLAQGVFAVALVLLQGVVGRTAWAHGDWPPRHGGIMNEGGETSFELVQGARGVYFYPSDHGEPLSAQGAVGKLTRVHGGAALTHDAKADGKERLLVQGLRVKAGERLTLRVVFAAGNIAVGRFVVPQPGSSVREVSTSSASSRGS